MYRLSLFLLLLGLANVLAASSSAPIIFCKCTCLTTSHIIPLGPPHDPSKKPPPNEHPSDTNKNPPGSEQSSISGRVADRGATEAASARATLERRAQHSYCAQCSRTFCYDYHLAGCEEVEPGDFVATCFQRDSQKDQIIVWGFILGTTGLLGWAAVRRALEMREVKNLGAGLPGRLGALGRMASGRAGGTGTRDASGVPRRGASGSSAAAGRDDDRRGSYVPVGVHSGEVGNLETGPIGPG